jgi:N-acetyl-alpha-D-muramate 1-phosphate uridylyltransferase
VTGPAGVVLAAGLGTRLRPLTWLRPKALCPVGGVPLLDLALRRIRPFAGEGRDRLAVNAHHLSDQVVAHVGDTAHVSVELPVLLGTAGALGRLRGWLDGRDVLLTNADSYLCGPLDDLVAGWDRCRCRLLVVRDPARGDFGERRYVGACLLPWRLVSRLPAEPAGLYEAMWRAEHASGRLELVPFGGTAIDCGTPEDYLRANLDASGGGSVVGAGAVVEGTVERCVVWDGAWVCRGEHLADSVRAGDRHHPVTVHAGRAGVR